MNAKEEYYRLILKQNLQNAINSTECAKHNYQELMLDAKRPSLFTRKVNKVRSIMLDLKALLEEEDESLEPTT